MTLVFELFMYLSVNNTKRDTAKLLKERHKKNNIMLFVRLAFCCFYKKKAITFCCRKAMKVVFL